MCLLLLCCLAVVRSEASALFEVVTAKLALTDVDQDVKDAAIDCAAELLAAALSPDDAKRDQVLELLLERLRNEVSSLFLSFFLFLSLSIRCWFFAESDFVVVFNKTKKR